MNIDYMQYLVDCAKATGIDIPISYQKTMKDVVIKLFDCKPKDKQSKKKLKLIDHYCHSELALHFIRGEYSKPNKTFTLKFSGIHDVDVIIQLQGSGLVFVRLNKTPLEELDPPVVLKTNLRALKPLNGILLHLLK